METTIMRVLKRNGELEEIAFDKLFCWKLLPGGVGFAPIGATITF
jgi:hypothetical protein